jgi:hypothetical protein
MPQFMYAGLSPTMSVAAESRRVDLADEDPAVDTDQQSDVRTTEVYGGQAGDEPVSEGTDEAPVRDEGAATVEARIEEAKQKAREMGDGDSS